MSDTSSSGDPLLTALVALVNEEELAFDITFVVGGATAAGKMVPASTFLKAMADEIRTAGGGSTEAFLHSFARSIEFIVRDQSDNEAGLLPTVACLHQAVIIDHDGQHEVGALRVTLSHVAAWHLGTPVELPKAPATLRELTDTGHSEVPWGGQA